MIAKERDIDGSVLLTKEQAAMEGLSFDDPSPFPCPWCGKELEPLGVALGGVVRWVAHAPCGCKGEAAEQERAEKAARAQAEAEMAARVARAGVKPRYANAQTSRPEFCRYIEEFERNEGQGLYIHGGVGSGKTTAASAMTRAFVYSGYRAELTTTIDMLDDIKASYSNPSDASKGIDAFRCCDILFLDDLGKENANSWAMTTLFQVINYRYEQLLPTITTSQYAPGELTRRLSRGGERETALAICSRLGQTCRPVDLGNVDRRKLR